MASLDFVYDLKERLEEEGIEFAICIVRHSEHESKIDMHLNLLSDESADMVCRAYDEICSRESTDEDIEIYFDDE